MIRPLLLANADFVHGGGEVGLRLLMTGLTARGYAPGLAVPGPRRLFEGVDQHSIASSVSAAAADLRALSAAYDVIHTFSIRAGRMAVRSASGKPFILHALIPTSEPGEQDVAVAAAAVVCNSRATSARFAGHPAVRVIYNGVPAPQPPRTPRLVREGRRTIAIVGNTSPRKGQLDVLPALDAVMAAMPDVDVIFAGRIRGVVGLALRDRAMAANGRIRTAGFVPDIADHLSSCDLVIVPSRSEGFGRVAVEALRAGTPVLATRVEGLREALAGLRDPWLPDDRAQWAERIARELSHPSHTSGELRAAAAPFAPERYLDEILECYRDVMSAAC